jgi:putative ABC transport system permease protein
MIKNYWKTAIRIITRYKGSSFINIFSLSVAIAFCILIFLYVSHEHSYDSFHKNAGCIYHVTVGSDSMVLNVSDQLGPKLKSLFPEIENIIRFGHADAEIKVDSHLFRETVYAADPAFFEVFDFSLRSGKIPFPEGNNDVTVLSPIAAEKYFGRDSPVDRILSLDFGDGFHDFIVTGVTKPIPNNSSIQFDILIPTRDSMFHDDEDNPSSWEAFDFSTFLKLSPHTDISQLQAKSDGFLKNNMQEVFDKTGLNVKDFSLMFLSLIDFHLKSQSALGGLVTPGNPIHSFILTGIGLLVLLISCFNFMNLSIARSSSRFKEIGARKVVGAAKTSLVKQFCFEATLVVCIAVVLGIILAELARPLFTNIVGKPLTLGDNLYSVTTLLFLAGMVLFISIVTGIYPALLISRLSLVDLFKGKYRIGKRNMITRLVIILQFAMSLFLIIEAIVIFKQKNFLLTQDLGFTKENVLAIPTKARQDVKNDGAMLLSLYKDKLEGQANILSISGASSILDKNISATIRQRDHEAVIIALSRVDFAFLQTLDISLKEGRNFSSANPADSLNSVLVNETFVKTFGLKNPVGESIAGLKIGKVKDPTIIGVVRDFHYTSLHEEIRPLILHMDDKYDINYIVVKIGAGRIPGILDALKNVWVKFRPDRTFEWFFLEDHVRQHYREENRWNTIVGYSSVFAIFIAAIGLFGLTGITISSRFKEIGIRKVLGASTLEIVKMINRQFILLVLTANVIVWPVAYIVSRKWLENFPYQTNLTVVEFFIGAMVVFGVAVLTMSAQALKASVLNSAELLRDE